MRKDVENFEFVVRHLAKNCKTIKPCQKCKLFLNGGCSFVGLINNSEEKTEENLSHIVRLLNENN